MRPRRYSTCPVNEAEVLAELDRRTKGYGSGARLAKEIGIELRHLHTIKSGNQPLNKKVAAGLGFELRWVRKGEQGNDRGNDTNRSRG
jgi:hypothetical protein